LYFVTSNPGSITVNGASSPITIDGLTSDTAYTFTVIAQNASGNSSPSSASGSVTVTSVPATPTAPTASSTVADQDSVTWSAPATGGKAISIYYWSCDDGKSGNTASTSVTVTQEGAGASTNAYRVIAANANGNSIVSGYSNSVDTSAPPFFPPFFPPYFAPPFFPPFFPPYFPGVFY
jgi:chitodextrinase